jgi:hypothetical protein
MRIQTQYGYTDIGPGNTTWSHFYTDRGGWYFDKKICSANSVQAPIVCATNCVHTTNLRGTGVTGNATPVLCIGHGAGSHTGDAIRIQASNSGRTIYTSGTVGSGCFYVTSSYNANPSVYTSGKFCSGNTFMCSNCICVAGTIRSANCVCAAQCLIAQCNVCGVGGVHSPIVCATTWVGVANGGILGIGTTCNNTGKLRFYNNNATNYYMDWVSNAARSYQFCGSGSSAAFKTCFVQGSTGGHDVYASGCLQSPIVCATAGANIGSAASQGTTLCVVAQNTAGAPATTTAIWLKGYEGRGIGTFFGDVTYAGKEWFTGMNYSGGFGSWNVGYDASGGQAEYGANTKFKVESSGTVVSYAVHTVCTCLQSPIVCATNFVKGNILCATATAGIGTAAHSTYPLMLGGNTRYQFAICNSGASNAYYPWLVHDTDNLIVHFNGIGDVLHLHRSGYLCTTGCIKSPVGYFSNYATIKGTGNNSGKSDFTVHTGGDATLALSGGEVRAGDNDVNWSMAMRRSGCLEAYGQELKLGVVEGNRNICLCPSGTGCVHMKGVLMLGSTAIAGEGSSDVIRTRNVASVHNYITTCSTGWGAWNQWIRYVAGVNTWRIGTFDAACASGLSLWRLAGRARTGNAEINYIVAGPRLTGGTDRVALYCPYTFTGGGYDGAGTHYPIGAGGIVCGATCVKSPIICSTGYICGNTICSIAEWFRNGASGTGLYNSATQQHWYSDHNDWWNIAGGGACNGIKFRDTHNGTTRGCILSNNSNQIGFVDSGGAWRILVNTSTDIRLCNNTCVYGNLYVSGLVCTEGVEGDAFSSVSCKLNSVSCFNTTCSTGHDAIYDIYVSANPNSGGSGVYRDVVHMTTYVTTGYDGMAVTKYINTVEHFSRGNAHSSGGGPVCASVHLLVGLVGCECYVQGCNTCLQVRICGGNTGTNAQYRTSECVLIKRVL